MKKIRIIHPLLISLYPILFLFSHNIGELSAQVVIKPLAVSFLAAVVLWWVLTGIFKSAARSALLTSLLLFLFFSYGHFEKLMADFKVVILGLWLGPTKILSVLWLGFIVLTVYGLRKSKSEFAGLTKFLNFISLCLVLLTVFNVALFYLQQDNRPAAVASNAAVKSSPNMVNTDPDIYYIILDEYLRSDMLKEIYRYDNSAFVSELQRRGFYIVQSARANYAHTALSVASSLNLRYVNEEAKKQLEGNSRSRIPIARLIEDNFLARFLRERGYRFIALNSGYWGTRIASADLFISGGNDEFFNQLANTSLLSLEQDINKRLWGKSLYDRYMTHMQRQRILNVFTHLQKIPTGSEPKLVFAHLVSPHPPFIFGPNGETVLFNAKLGLFVDDAAGLIGHDGMTYADFQKRYNDQVHYLNQLLLQTVDKIKQQAQRPVIIILQGDHGPRSLSDWEESDNPVRRLRMLKERMCILNAICLPDSGNSILYDDMTPVNTFRLILNRCFGQNFEKLPDRVYFSGGDSYFRLHEVTDVPLTVADSTLGLESAHE